MRTTSPRGPRSAVLVGFLVVALGGCGAGRASLSEAVGAWHSGERDHSLSAARAEYRRFRDANGLEEADVREAARDAANRLSETPVWPTGDGTPPDAAGTRDTPRGALRARLREDLLSKRVTAVARGILVVRDLELGHEAPTLLTIVYDRRVLEADDGVLAEASPALRNVAVKRLALDALEHL